MVSNSQNILGIIVLDRLSPLHYGRWQPEKCANRLSIARSVNSSKASDYPLWHVVVASITTGLLVGVYILVMGRLNVDQSVEDPLKMQVTEIANKLVSISETDSSFGYIGLCDSTSSGFTFGGESRRITSLNSAKASLHVAALVAKGLGSTAAEGQIHADLDDLDAAERRLIAQLAQAVAPGARDRKIGTSNNAIGTDNKAKEETPLAESTSERLVDSSFHAKVLKALQKNDPTDLRTVAISIQLGRYKDPDTMKTLAHPQSEAKEPFVTDGYFRGDFPVPVCSDRFVRFLPLADKVKIADPANFILAAPGTIPNAVLLEVQYEPRGKSASTVQVVRRSCAVLGGSAPATMPSCFLFRFPQGLTQNFKTPAGFLNRSLWNNTGTWQQASGGTVPGAGKLKLTIDPVLPAMTPDQSLAIGLYHWIRHMRPAPDPEAVLAVMHQKFPEGEIRSNSADANLAPVNSCLVSDTGAREHSFSKNTEKGSEGQLAIEQCFEYSGQLDPYPQSAIPLYVDRTGNVNLAGRTGFDAELVSKYLTAVYSSNLAAIESAATAKLVSRQSALENRELLLKLSIVKQELSSSIKRLASMKAQMHGIKDDTAAAQMQVKIEKTEKSIEEYKSTIATLDSRIAQLQIVNNLTRMTLLNSERAIAKTYEICSTTFTLLRNGLHVLDAPSNGFLLGRKHLFIPLKGPVKESDFFDASGWTVKDPIEQADRYAAVSPWFQKHLPVLVSADEMLATGVQFTIDGKPASAVLAEVEVADNMPPLTVLLDSRELTTVSQAQLHTSSNYPFAGTPVAEDQAFFYAKSATSTGANTDVVWSVVMRDLVLHENIAPGKVLTGSPSSGWEKRFTPPLASTCGLAVEFQLRRPLPKIVGIPAGAYITEPNKRLITPQIPPIPVELM